MKFTGAGIYGIYNVMENRIYIGKSANIPVRLSQHKSNFATHSDINPMYKEPVDNFIFLVLHKMTKKNYMQFGDLMEDLFISLALRRNIKLYNINKVRLDVTSSALFAFGIIDSIGDAIFESTGTKAYHISQMNKQSRARILQNARKNEGR